ncbi:MAG: N-acetyltransferase [Lachnospiraceae bacterium]|nr:N-acetyltransferase [Lachnospiraceae bacterium]
MKIQIRNMNASDYIKVEEIYLEGIKTKCATFQTEAPSFEQWDASHLKECRLVAVEEKEGLVIGWAALSPISSRCVYRGVCEMSIYIAECARGQHVGFELINEMIRQSEKCGIWTLQSAIFQVNEASIALHKKCGFREVGIRERIAKDQDGKWQNTVLMERRSSVVGL